MPGCTAAAPRGAPVPTIPSWIWSIGARAMRNRTTPGLAAVWTVCTHPACSRSGRRPASSPAIFSTRRTTSTTWTASTNMSLADIRVGGQLRKVAIQANKNGFLYVLDRTNCKLIAAHPFAKVNWATRIDLATGRPVLTDVYKRFLAGEEVEIFPQRGSNAVPIAFSPNTGLVYTSSWNMPRIQKLAPPKTQVIGTNSTGVVGRIPVFKPGDVVGHFVAIDPLTGEKKMGDPAGRYAELGRDAGDRRRARVLGQADRRVRRARRGDRRNVCGSSRPARASMRRRSPTLTTAVNT